MTISYSNFFAPTVLGTTVGTLMTVPATPSGSLLRGGRVRFTNTSAVAATVAAFAVPAAGTAADGNCFLKSKSIAAGDYLDIDIPLMPAGSILQAQAGAATSITAHMIAGSLFS